MRNFRKDHRIQIGIFLVSFFVLFIQSTYAYQSSSLRPPSIFSESEKGLGSLSIYLQQLKDFEKAKALYKEAIDIYSDRADDDINRPARFKITEAYKICLGILAYFKENKNKTMDIDTARKILDVLEYFVKINPLSKSERTEIAIKILKTLVKTDRLSDFATIYGTKEPKIELPPGFAEQKVLYTWKGSKIELISRGVVLDPEKIKRVFIFPYSVGLGDILKLDPLFKTLKRHVPGVKISCMVPSSKKDLIDSTCVDEILDYTNDLDARRNIDELYRLVDTKSFLYREGGFDLAIIPYDAHRDRSIALCNKMGIPYIITEGCTTDHAIEPTNTVTLRRADKKSPSYRYRHDDIDIAHSFAALLFPLINNASYLEEGHFAPQIKTEIEEDRSIREYLESNKIKDEDFVVLIAPSTASAAKWPEYKVSFLISRLNSKHSNMKFILLKESSPEDEGVVNEILKRLKVPCVTFISNDNKSFRQIATRANIFIANNSGPSHLFDAFNNGGVPEIVIYENQHVMSRWQPKSDFLFPILAEWEDINNVEVEEVLSLVEILVERENIKKYLAEYAHKYEAKHKSTLEEYLDFSPERLKRSLLNYRNIRLSFGQKRPVAIPQKKRQELVRATRSYLNGLPRPIRTKIYKEKLSNLQIGKSIRDYLLRYGDLRPEQKAILDKTADFFKAGGDMLDIKDMSSHRIWEEGDEVYIIKLKLGEHVYQIVFKTGGNVRNEEFYSKYAAFFDTTSADARFYNAGGIEFVLMRYIDSNAFSSLIAHDKQGLPIIKDDSVLYSSREEIVKQLARYAAVSDIIAKGDRQLGIFKVHSRTYGNYLVSGREDALTVYPIDNSLLFADRAHIRKWSRSGKSESSFIALFESKMSSKEWQKLIDIFKIGYLKSCSEVESKRAKIIALAQEYFDAEKIALVERNMSRYNESIEENIDDLLSFTRRLKSCTQYYGLPPKDYKRKVLTDIVAKIKEGRDIFPEEESILLGLLNKGEKLDDFLNLRIKPLPHNENVHEEYRDIEKTIVALQMNYQDLLDRLYGDLIKVLRAQDIYEAASLLERLISIRKGMGLVLKAREKFIRLGWPCRHSHANFDGDDGKLTPEGLVDHAINNGITTLYVTGHDTLEGSLRAMEYVRDLDYIIAIKPGVEIEAPLEDEEGRLFAFMHWKIISPDDPGRLEEMKKVVQEIDRRLELFFDARFKRILLLADRDYFDRHVTEKVIDKLKLQYDVKRVNFIKSGEDYESIREKLYNTFLELKEYVDQNPREKYMPKFLNRLNLIGNWTEKIWADDGARRRAIRALSDIVISDEDIFISLKEKGFDLPISAQKAMESFSKIGCYCVIAHPGLEISKGVIEKNVFIGYMANMAKRGIVQAAERGWGKQREETDGIIDDIAMRSGVNFRKNGSNPDFHDPSASDIKRGFKISATEWSQDGEEPDRDGYFIEIRFLSKDYVNKAKEAIEESKYEEAVELIKTIDKIDSYGGSGEAMLQLLLNKTRTFL